MDTESPVPEKEGQEPRGRSFPCESCGADLIFGIGVQALCCTFCGFEKSIPLDEDFSIEERDLDEMLQAQSEKRIETAKEDLEEENSVRCEDCNAEVIFRGTLTTTSCAYCGSPIHLKDSHRAEGRIPVDGIIPFGVPEESTRDAVKQWIRSRWFAPNNFLKINVPSSLQSVYLPYWTFDALTFTSYRGERGDYHSRRVHRSGKSVTVRELRWSSVSGSFQRMFDDQLVLADEALPRKVIKELEPWPLERTRSYTPELLTGHLAKTYDVPLKKGFQIGKARMEGLIETEVKERIGGDAQRIRHCKTRWDALTYKHLLLPVWLLSLRFQKKVYQITVNGITGEVQGQRPWSWVKIGLAFAAGLGIAGLGLAYYNGAL